MSKWATFDRDKLINLRNERSEALRRMTGARGTVKTLERSLEAVTLIAAIDAIDCILEASGKITFEDEATRP